MEHETFTLNVSPLATQSPRVCFSHPRHVDRFKRATYPLHMDEYPLSISSHLM